MTSCDESKISTKNGSRWLEQYHATRSILPVRHRDSIAGQVPGRSGSVVKIDVFNIASCILNDYRDALPRLGQLVSISCRVNNVDN